MNWSSFNIRPGETTTFLQPSANSVVFNQIGDANPSQIFGNLNANGTVILANAKGFYFGPNSMISVGGSFIATTAPLSPDFGAGSAWQFTGMPPLAKIINYGQIKVGTEKSLYLIAEQIENHGELTAPGGDVGLYAGQSVLVSERPDGRGLSATMRLPGGSVNNYGQIIASAGTIALQAQVVNQNGILQADSVQNHNGVIELIASESVNLGAESQILARGDDSVAGSAGGVVTIKSGNNFHDAVGSEILVTGGVHGGNGGDIEVSAPNVLSLDSHMDATAQNGWDGGTFFLDPVNIILGTSTAGGAINVNTAFAGFSEIILQATGNITLNANTTWNLSASTGISAGQLTLEAGGDITFANGSKIFDANNWSVTLNAGYNFVNNTINSGVGNIYLNGGAGRTLNGTIQLSSGDVNLLAGQSILIGSGSVYTTGGGNIYANALAGDINAGTANGGYVFSINGYSTFNQILGGISTGAGGDVTLIAGNNITSIPTTPSGQRPGASGAYGAGNVTVIAGNLVQGSYTLANGVGTILAGVQLQNSQPVVINPAANIGTTERGVSLSLISGSWNAWSGGNTYIAEVRNPNGTFNRNKRPVTGQFGGNIGHPDVPTQTAFAFDYAANAAVHLWAGNGIELIGRNRPRVRGQNQDMRAIYAPILSLDAGAGGITIDNSIILYTSSQGSKQITTRDAGNLVGVAQATSLTGITMSDSGLPGWATFEQGHAITPLHLHDANPVTLNISGSIGSFGLTVPTFAEIQVDGTQPFITPDGESIFGAYNFGFSGRNLSSAQTTRINVVGDIAYRGNLSSVSLSSPLPSALFSLSLSGNPVVAGKLRYINGRLTYIGVMSSDDLAFLLNPTRVKLYPNGSPIYVLDADGNRVLDANGLPIPVLESVALNDAQIAAINNLYAASQSATLGDQGLALAGAGRFEVNARNIDLGISGGISVVAPDAVLAAISPYGADLTVTTSGNLSLTSTKISNESLLGSVNLNVGGSLDVGGQFSTTGDPNAPKGIFTTSSGDISITTVGNINVNGSRIATYNGGDINITSVNGDVNAGAGGAGYVSVNALELNSRGQLFGIPATIPGSGILATTVRGSHAALGDITVNTPDGSINASSGGILQIAFNNASTVNNFVKLNAAQDITANGSGVIGYNISLQAGGNIKGLVIGRQSVAIDSQQNVSVTAFSGGNVDISAGGNISGTVIGGGSVNVSGDSISASLISQNVSASGDTSSATEGIPQSNVTQNNAQNADNAETATSKNDNDDADALKKRKPIALAQKVGRVTVVLPVKKE